MRANTTYMSRVSVTCSHASGVVDMCVRVCVYDDACTLCLE